MKRRTKLVLGALLAACLVAGGAGWYWWHRQHTWRGEAFNAPVVAAVPARIRLLPVAIGGDRPTDIQFVPGGGTRAIVLEQGGRARLVDFGPALEGGAPVDISKAPLVIELWVRVVSETGLLSLAFHPQYAERGTFYVYYHPWEHNKMLSRIAEFKLPLAELGKHPAVQTRTLIEVDQTVGIHQGGGLAFGPDGKLYVGLGDGSVANDPDNNAQNLGVLRGKLLRLDVDGTSLIPSDNPFVNQPGARPEVWAYGLRNPWRISFNAAGHVLLGDVGQEAREELDLVTAGANMGWNQREGSICSQVAPKCTTAGMIDPIYDYERTEGSSITGGFEVTGTRVPELTGKYVFADFVRGRIWSTSLPSSAPAAGTAPPGMRPELLGEWPRLISSFGRDAAGDLYVTDLASGELLAVMPLK